MDISDNEIVFTIIFTTLVILLLVAGIVISIFMYRKQFLKRQIQELAFQKELREAESAMAESVMTHVSRELHDNIGQLLTVINLQMETHKLDDPSCEIIMKPIQETLDEAHHQLRSLSRSLNTDYITKNGFINTLKVEIDRLKKLRKMEVHLSYDDEVPALSKDQQLMAFRIFQEIISNSLKYSNANNFSVTVKGGRDFQMLVADDGKGFDMEKTINSPSSNGLNNIKRRAELADLNCKIESEIGKGCIYHLSKK